MEHKEVLKSLIFLFAFSLVVKGETICPDEVCWNNAPYCCNGYCCGEVKDAPPIPWWVWLIVALMCLCTCCMKGASKKVTTRSTEVRTSYNSISNEQSPYAHTPRDIERCEDPRHQQIQTTDQPPPPYQ